jgi:hypothetical protein
MTVADMTIIDVWAFKVNHGYGIKFMTEKAREFVAENLDAPPDIDMLYLDEPHFEMLHTQLTTAGLLVLIDDSGETH